MSPFDKSNISKEPLEDAKVAQITNPANTPAGFWNHYIGGTIALANLSMQEAELTGRALDRESVTTVQARIIQYAGLRLTSPGSADDLERKSCEALLAASASFDWASEGARELFIELRDAVYSLGNYHMALSGKRSL